MYQPFTLFRRKSKNKNRPIYYAQFRDKNGKRLTARSTGKTNKAEAFEWALEEMAKGDIDQRRGMLLGDYAHSWFLWDKCDFLARKRARGSYSRSYAEYQRGLLVRHILPTLATQRIEQITPAEIEHWLVTTKKQVSPVIANRALTVLKIMLSEAVRQGIITSSPASVVEGLREISQEKGTLTISQVKLLFSRDALTTFWSGNLVHMALNAIAFTTGMRMGEIQALRWQDIGTRYIRVEHNWDRKYGLKEPKASSTRVVPLTPTVARLLSTLADFDSDREPDWMVFHGDDRHRPIDHKAITKYFHRALNAIGITDEEQKTSRISFHSWRHTFHTLMRGTMTDVELRRIAGHRTERMTEHYDHVTIDLVHKISPIIEQMLIDQTANVQIPTNDRPIDHDREELAV
jgi:integrase